MDEEEIVIQTFPVHEPKWTEEEVFMFTNGLIRTRQMTRGEFEERFGKIAQPIT